MRVSEQTEFTVEIADDLRRLLPQLSSSAASPSHELIRSIVVSGASRLLVAREGGVVYGFLTLVVFPIPTGVRAWIEDVVVDSKARGKGVGEKLSLSAIEIAQNCGARTVELTSRPSRESANRLYKRIGFVERDTNVYRYTIK